MKIVCATHNKHKVTEFRRILSPMGIDVVSCDDMGLFDEIEETGTTFEENARIKAKYVCDKLNLPAFADDSGIAVDALDGAPGVYSARYGKPEFDDRDRRLYLLEQMEGKTNRLARFVCAICLCFPDGREFAIKEDCEGEIADCEIGENGFGYDPIFLVNGKSFGSIGDSEKDRLSHRGKATREFVKLIEKEWRK